MIPKIIHYCWFGNGEMPKKEKKCVASWGRYMPDYTIYRWDEDSFDISKHRFAKEAYEAKKYAFVADLVRVEVLNRYGGIYLDTDVEVLKSFDELLGLEMFSGFETEGVIQTGVIGSGPQTNFLLQLVEYYKNRPFVNPDQSYIQTPNSRIFMDILHNNGLVMNNSRQRILNVDVFPSDYFCPINQATQEICVTKNSYCIHYLSGSWLPKRSIYSRRIKVVLGSCIGYQRVDFIRSVILRVSSLFKL